ncbi:hypothetical protein ACLOJK_013378 [Asimina triloba]
MLPHYAYHMESEAIDGCLKKNRSLSLSLLVSENRKGLEEKPLSAGQGVGGQASRRRWIGAAIWELWEERREMVIIERERENAERKKKKEMVYLGYNNGDHPPTVSEIGNGVGGGNRRIEKSKMTTDRVGKWHEGDRNGKGATVAEGGDGFHARKRERERSGRRGRWVSGGGLGFARGTRIIRTV